MLSLISQFDSISNDLYDKAAELEDFAVEIRYPDTTIDLTDEDIKEAFIIVKEFRDFVISKMNISVDYDDFDKKE